MPKSKEFVSDSDSESERSKKEKSESEEQSDSDYEPKLKKRKPARKRKVGKESNEAEGKDEEKEVSKKLPSGSAVKGSGGEWMFQLANMRYVTVSVFRGKAMVGIREYYDSDGEMKPGKKGISLPINQWEALKNQIEAIDAAISNLP